MFRLADIFELATLSLSAHIGDNDEANLTNEDANNSPKDDEFIGCPVFYLVAFCAINQHVLSQNH